MVAATVLVAGCTVGAPRTGTDAGSAVVPPAPELPVAGGGIIILVLPPSDGLAPPERRRVRALAERAVREHVGLGGWQALEPATSTALADTLAIAVRRAGVDGTVCLVGARGRTVLVPLLARYPAARVCLVPGSSPSGLSEPRAAIGDVDLLRLAQDVGAAARAAAGDGAVLLLDGGDPMLDVRWRQGIEEGVLGAAGAVGPSLGIVTTAAEAVDLLDAQAALIADGVVPGTPEATSPDDAVGDGSATRDGLPSDGRFHDARTLRSITVVVLDAGTEAARLAPLLAERGIRVVAPTSLLRSGDVAPEDVVLHWSVRWDVALAAAIAPEDADGPPPSGTDRVDLQPGLAAAG